MSSTMAIATKRPLTDADSEGRDPESAKRQAVEAAAGFELPQNGHPQWRPSFEITEDQLDGKVPDELVELILEMQASYQRQLATISAQYDDLNQQLLGVRSCLSILIGRQSSALEEAASVLVPGAARPAPGPPPSHLPARAPEPRPFTSNSSRSSSLHIHARQSPPPPVSNLSSSGAQDPTYAAQPMPIPIPTPTRPPPVPVVSQTPHPPPAPTSTTPRQSSVAAAAAAAAAATSPSSQNNDTPSSLPTMASRFQVFPAEEDGAPPRVVYSTANSVSDVWREYRYGMDGQPSIESLDSAWGPRWRPEPKGRTWYSRRKLVWDKIKELVYDGLSEEAAVGELERLRAGRSMNWLMNILQNDRKEVKASWKAAAKAAAAAKREAREAAVAGGVIKNYY